MKKRILILLLQFIFLFKNVKADEGMWLPLLLKSLCESDMKAKGLKLSAEDLYSVNQSSLKDAIVLFGGGCTGEIVSDKGLLFTNHHCGIGQVQYHSSVENDYLKNGFWAKSFEEELPNPNLTVTFIVRIEDVTATIKSVLESNQPDIQKKFMEKMDELEKNAVAGTHYEAEIRAFDYGNAYYMFVTETFKDVRLVGVPPQALGEFGGDTDNWMWPRHTADFSVFRIYANKENKPAEYSKDNVPYIPKRSLQLNTDGVVENDFAMVYGFPGRTQQYLPATEVEFIIESSDPARIAMRDKGLEVINAAMRSNDKIRIQYTAKESRISNAWKKWKGEIMGLKKTNALEKKKKFEEDFTNRLQQNSDFKSEYGTLLGDFTTLFNKNRELLLAYDYFNEFYYSTGPELLKFAGNFENIVNNYSSLESSGKLKEVTDKLKNSIKAYYKNLDLTTDKELFKQVLPVYLKGCPKNYQPEYLVKELEKKKQSVDALVEEIYSSTLLKDGDALLKLLEKPSSLVSKMKNDKMYLMMLGFLSHYRKNMDASIKSYVAQHDQFLKKYVKAIYEVIPEKKIWHDANSTLRIGYGQVKGSEPRDGMMYDYYTTTEGMMEKHLSGAAEYELPERFKELITKKSFGKYADKEGNLRTCFTTTSQTTGGNSGSPVLNAYGELIGLNFDRSWESTMSDIMYSPQLCRNIVCDIRYVLFVIDVYAGSEHLMKELKLTNQKKKDEESLKQLQEQGKVLDEQIKRNPTNIDLLYDRGNLFIQTSKTDEALTDAQTIMKANSKSVKGWKLAAMVYGKKKDYTQAVFHAEKALMIDQKDVQTRLLLIESAYYNQSFKKATDAVKQVQESELNIQLCVAVARSFYAQANKAEAQKWYQKARKMGLQEQIKELE